MAAEQDGTTIGRGEGLAQRVDRVAAWAPALAALPAAVAAVAVLVQGWTPAGDQAFEVLRVADVGTGRTPLVGAYSRWGWNHPGPLLFWLAAPGYRLAGPPGVAATVALLTAAGAAGAVVAARRLGGALLAGLTAVAALVLGLSLGDRLVDPWNPYVGALPLLAYVLCAWRAAEGDRVALAAAVVAGSYAGQAHVGYLPVVAATAALAGGVAVVRWRRGALGPPRLRAALGVAGLGGALWSGPLVEQFVERGGNLLSLWDWSTEAEEPAAGWSVAVDVASRLFGVPAPWMGAPAAHRSGMALPASPGPMIALVAAVTALAVVSWRRGDRRAAGLAGLALALVAVSVAAVARVTGTVAPYLLMWSWPVAALVWVAGAWAAVRLVAGAPGVAAAAERLDRPTAAAGLALVAAAALAVMGAVAGAAVTPAESARGAAVADLSAQVRRELDPNGGYAAVAVEPGSWGAVGYGVAADLLRRGWDVRLPEGYELAVGEWRVTDDPADRPRLAVVERTGRPWTRPPGARRVAARDAAGGAPGYDVWVIPGDRGDAG
ncbi:MAG TPA: hypothetical protein VIL48_06175 [Acidimicrobiales bacterium]